MENYKKIIEDIKRVHPKIKIFWSQDKLFPSIKHFVVSDDTARGYGVDLKVGQSLTKAYAEYIERKLIPFLSKSQRIISSSGLAVHTHKTSAIENAKNELQERDQMLSSWYSKLGPQWFEELPESMTEPFFRFGFDISLGVFQSNSRYKTYVGTLESKTFPIGFVLDTTTSLIESKAIEKLLLSLSFAGTIILNRKKTRKPLYQKVNSTKLLQPSDLFEYYLNPKKKSCLYDYKNYAPIHFSPERKNIKVKVYDIVDFFPTALSINFLAHAKDDNLQEYFVGAPLINKKRLTRLISSKKLIINEHHHPLA